MKSLNSDSLVIPGTSSHPAIPGNNDQVDISFENCSLKRLHHYNMFSLMFFKLYHYHIFSLVYSKCSPSCLRSMRWWPEVLQLWLALSLVLTLGRRDYIQITMSQCHIVTMSQCHNVIMTQCRNVTLYLGLTLGKIDYIQLTMSHWEKGSMRWLHNFSFGIDANHLITCSFMAAPCSLAVSKLFYPETEQTKTAIEV